MNVVAFRSMAGALVFVSVAAVSAQSLADVARQEEERRKTVRSSGRVYTNDSLRPDSPTSGTAPRAAAAPPNAPPAEVSAPPKPTGPEPAAAEAPKTEAEWRARVAAVRDALSRARIVADALQSRINVLSADFVNRDDPAQRDVVFADRQKALAELDRVKGEIQQHQRTLAAIEDAARRAGVPAGWAR